jgi:hypothetical protein
MNDDANELARVRREQELEVEEQLARRRRFQRSKYPALRVSDAASQRDVTFLTAALADPTMRGSAALALGRLKAREAVPGLVRNLRVNRDLDRNAAVIALGRIGDTSAAPALLEVALHDESWSIRNSAIDALAVLNDPQGVRLLAQLAVGPERAFAGTSRSFNATPRLFNRRPPIRWTRRWAMRRLRKLRAIDALAVLEPAPTWRLSPHALRLTWTIHALRKARREHSR